MYPRIFKTDQPPKQDCVDIWHWHYTSQFFEYCRKCGQRWKGLEMCAPPEVKEVLEKERQQFKEWIAHVCAWHRNANKDETPRARSWWSGKSFGGPF
jgi:hypothetical protein